MMLIEDKKIKRCEACVEIAARRYKTTFTYRKGVPKPKRELVDEVTRKLTCDKEHGHPGSGETVFAFHTSSCTFHGVKLKHAWTDEECGTTVDITERWEELL